MNIPAALIEACLRQDRKAQSELYRRCFGVLMGICMRYLSNEQEAVATLNQGFLKILHGLKDRNPNAPLEAWMRRIMINTVIDEYRRQRKYHEKMQVEDFGETTAYDGYVDVNEADQRLDAEELEQMIQALPPMSRQVFNLYAVDGYSHREIAELLGISEGTSKWHVSSARSQLKAHLAQRIHRSEKTKL